jgi:non-heme chloroperoxidase
VALPSEEKPSTPLSGGEEIRTSFVRAPDGVRIAVDEAGPPHGTPVVFLHGIAQSRRAFRSVLTGPLAAELRLVAIDLRGHGDSDRPEGDAAYAGGDRLGGDLHAVCAALSLSRPVLVAWSYGGVVVGEYLRSHGAEGLGAILFAAAAVKVGKPAKALFGPAMLTNGRALMSEDPATYEAGARAFLGACAAGPIDAAFLEQSVSEMRCVPARVRRALLGRSEDYSAELSRCALPAATLHGALDLVILPEMSEQIASLVPGTESTLLPGVGHVAFIEAPDAFFSAIRALVARRAASIDAAPLGR